MSGYLTPGNDEFVCFLDGFGNDLVVLGADWIGTAFLDGADQVFLLARPVGEEFQFSHCAVFSVPGEVDETASGLAFDQEVVFLPDGCGVEQDDNQVAAVELNKTTTVLLVWVNSTVSL